MILLKTRAEQRALVVNSRSIFSRAERAVDGFEMRFWRRLNTMASFSSVILVFLPGEVFNLALLTSSKLLKMEESGTGYTQVNEAFDDASSAVSTELAPVPAATKWMVDPFGKQNNSLTIFWQNFSS